MVLKAHLDLHYPIDWQRTSTLRVTGVLRGDKCHVSQIASQAGSNRRKFWGGAPDFTTFVWLLDLEQNIDHVPYLTIQVTHKSSTCRLLSL